MSLYRSIFPMQYMAQIRHPKPPVAVSIERDGVFALGIGYTFGVLHQIDQFGSVCMLKL